MPHSPADISGRLPTDTGSAEEKRFSMRLRRSQTAATGRVHSIAAVTDRCYSYSLGGATSRVVAPLESLRMRMANFSISGSSAGLSI